MSIVSDILDDVRRQLAPTDAILKEARARRSRVLQVAGSFDGVRDNYYSGSIAHGTANSDLDADCGIFLDRRTHPDLGPDGEGRGPNETVEAVRKHIAAELAGDDAKEVRCTKRRAIQVSFDTEPNVDLVVALDRKSEPGVWIPNRPEDEWDPAHPSEHTRLLLQGGPDLVRVRARVVRLAKGWDAQFKSRAVSSFNIEALALECVDQSMTEALALAEVFSYGAKTIEANGETDDPAHVSGPIRLLLDRDVVVARLQKAAELMSRAIDHEDDEGIVREALAELFWDYVSPPEGSTGKAAVAAAARSGSTFSVGGSGLVVGSGVRELKQTRSYGDAQPK